MPTMFKADQPTAKALRAKAKRLDAAMAKFVRAVCVERDGYCALDGELTQRLIGPCGGPSEWAHHHDRMRSKTRGMEPSYRHAASHSFMACRAHHRGYDAHDFEVVIHARGGMNVTFGVRRSEPKTLRRAV
jgi:hypothetical protein